MTAPQAFDGLIFAAPIRAPAIARGEFVAGPAEPFVSHEDGLAILRLCGDIDGDAPGGNRPGVLAWPSIAEALRAIREDAEIGAAVLAIASCGGEAEGALQAIEAAAALAAVKPVVAFIESAAASAAYALAAPARHIVIAPDGRAGALVAVRVATGEASRMRIAPEASSRIAGDDELAGAYGALAEAIAWARPRLGREGVARIGAMWATGAMALRAGLADSVGGIEEAKHLAREAMAAVRSAALTPEAMVAPTSAPAPETIVAAPSSSASDPAPATEEALLALAQRQCAAICARDGRDLAEMPGMVERYVKGYREGRLLVRNHCRAVLESPQGLANYRLAREIALMPNLSTDEALRLLDTMIAVTNSEPHSGRPARRMDAVPRPNVIPNA